MRDTVASESPTTFANARFVIPSRPAALRAAFVTTADGSGLAAAWERGVGMVSAIFPTKE
jgi:hypothetical protein